MPGSLLKRCSPLPAYSVAPCCVTRYCSGESLEMALRSFLYICMSFFGVVGRRTKRSRGAPSAACCLLLAQRPETRANLLREDFRLFPGRKVPAFLNLVVVDQFGKCPLCPTPRGRIEFVRKDAHGNGDGDTFGIEIPFAPIFPVETGARKRRVRQPGERDVVEDVVAREALGLSVEDARDELVAARVVIEEIRRQADGGIRDAVQRLRSQAHLEAVADALAVDEAQSLIRDLLLGGETRGRRRTGKRGLVDVEWNHVRHVGVNAQQFRRRLRAHQ